MHMQIKVLTYFMFILLNSVVPLTELLDVLKELRNESIFIAEFLCLNVSPSNIL